ncbi:MAG TPA: hypothetical protein VGL59_15815 [Polyangia bacterium]|jgi:hypothetical protein
MRTWTFTRFALVCAALPGVVLLPLACQEGPKDNYKPAPPSAQIDSPKAPPFASDGSAPFATPDGGAISVGGTNKNDICTAPDVKLANEKYFSAPILPNVAGNIDIMGGMLKDGQADPNWDPTKPAAFHYDINQETFSGVTIDQLEKTHCQATPVSIFSGDTATYGWGSLGELSVQINTDSRIVTDILIQTGYLGSVTATSSDKTTVYTINFQTNLPPTKTVNGSAPESVLFPPGWDDSHGAVTKIANQLYDALRSTYAPKLPAEPDCTATGHCIIGNNKASGGYLWFTPLNMAFFVNSTVAPSQLELSTFTLLDIGASKTLGFTFASSLLKLDAEGPLAKVTNVFGTGKDCNYHLGMNFGDFQNNCVEPFTDATSNQTEERKLLGGISHGNETYSFDVLGIDPQFAASSLSANAVVGDSDRPQATDVAYQYTVDQEVLGPIANDFINNDSTIPTNKDWHGLGLLTLQLANRVQKYMQRNYGVTASLGDPECVAAPFRTAAQRTAAGLATANAATVCSGLEGIVTTAPPAAVVGYPGNLAVNALGAAILTDTTNQSVANGAFQRLGLGMKPGTWVAYFCNDNQGLDATGHPVGYDRLGLDGHGSRCTANFYLTAFESQVASAFSAMGGVDPPTALADFRFFFQQWILAFIQYLEVAGSPTATLAQIDARLVSLDNLFFDSAGGGFEFAEYVDRSAVNAGQQPPMDVRVIVNLLTSVIDAYSFTRYSFRGEQALYKSLTVDPKDYPGAEDVLLSNLVGSSVLVSTYGAYPCAINDPLNPNPACGDVFGPADAMGNLLLDDNGNPLLSKYKSAFGKSNFYIPGLGAPAPTSPLQIPQSMVETNIAQVVVQVPQWTDPYNVSPTMAGTTPPPMISVLLPYAPIGAGVGFPVSIDGTRDKMVNTYNVDFSGVSVSANVDYDYKYDASGKAIGTVVKAVETTDYLGLVFACAEPNQMNPGVTDVLAVRMYTPAQDILDWFADHPQGAADCDLVIRYSLFGNQVDFITTRATGVRFGINPGINAGNNAGRVVDVTVFDPNVVFSLGN